MKRERVMLRTIGLKIKEVRKNAPAWLIMNPDSDLPPDSKKLKRGMTQYEFAHALGVSIDTVKNWEQCYNYPRIEDIDKICRIFHCKYDYLFGADDRMQEDLGLSEDALYVLRKVKEWGDHNIVSHFLENIDFIEALLKLIDTDYSDALQVTQNYKMVNIALPEVIHDMIKILFVLWKFIEKERTIHNRIPLKRFIDHIHLTDTRLP